MKIVVVGDGKFGNTLIQHLAKDSHDLVVVDSNEEALRHVVNQLDVMGIPGNGASINVQLEAGVPDADLVIASASTDELNILTCLTAKKLGAKHTIARVRNPDYTEQLAMMKEELGLSLSVNPELAAAREIVRILRFPAAVKIDSFARGRVDLVEFRIGEGSPLIGSALKAIRARLQLKILVCAVQRGNDVFIPGGDFVLRQGDKIHVTGSQRELAAFARAIGIVKHRIRSVMIIGGGKISYYLASLLFDAGVSVTIVEKDPERSRVLTEVFPKARIICGDGTDEEILQENGIRSADAFVALTDNDEENIMMSMYAASCGDGKVITKINRLTFTSVIENSGIDSIITPKYIASDIIVRFVRAMQNSLGISTMETLHHLVNNQVEAMEFHVLDASSLGGRPLSVLQPHFQKDILIACILRQGNMIIPGGSDVIKDGDNVIIVTTNTKIRDFNDIFERGEPPV